jgi:protein-S-isoprenylcysteine O-methyltransferase Ste14
MVFGAFAGRVAWLAAGCLLLLYSVYSPIAHAADIFLDLNLASIDRQVTATVVNRSAIPVQIADFQLELNRKRYSIVSSDRLAAHSERSYQLQVVMPELPGSYLIHSRLHYPNENRSVSLQNLGIFYVVQRGDLPSGCRLEAITVKTNRQRVELQADESLNWRLFLPDEIILEQGPEAQNGRFYWLNSPIPGLVNRYTIYAGAERVAGGVHQAGLCSAPLTADGQPGRYERGKVADVVLFLATGGAGLGVLLIGMGVGVKAGREGKLTPCACYLARLFFIGSAYLVLRHAPAWFDAVDAAYPAAGLDLFSNHFQGDSYRFFFDYFADAYFWGYLVIGLPYFLFFARPCNLQADKYHALLVSLFSLPRLFAAKSPVWNNISRLGFLTVMVKLFFLPYMVSWGIQNIRHIGHLLHGGYFDFQRTNDLFQTVFMLIDTGIFAFGYLIESRRLGSEIKSVDPTFLGWLVCLWCYPPFNSFSFRYFDYPLLDIHMQTSAAFQAAMTALVTGLWGVFCVASINLGFKASNLTNRGIVKHGLYRYVRHPAYACKILAWVIQGVFLGQYTLGILLAFTVVYVLRALTEEWHLGRDSEYVAYKRQVPWRFIPRVL